MCRLMGSFAGLRSGGSAAERTLDNSASEVTARVTVSARGLRQEFVTLNHAAYPDAFANFERLDVVGPLRRWETGCRVNWN